MKCNGATRTLAQSMKFFFSIVLTIFLLSRGFARESDEVNGPGQPPEATSNQTVASHDSNGNMTQPKLFRPFAQTLAIKHRKGQTYRLKGKFLDDGGSKMTFIGFILSEKPLREIMASSDPSEFLVPMTGWEPDQSVPPDRFGLDGLALDGSLNFYADVELDPEKLYYYWTITANAVGHTSGSPKKLKTPSDKVHWWSKDNLLAGGWRNSSWLGTFRPHASGWIYHTLLGWSFAHPDENSGLWLWLKKEGWLWTHPKAFPYLWRHRTKSWVFLWGKENGRPLLIEWFSPNEETPFEKRSRANWLTIELAQASFPPTVTKFGFNAEWTEKNPADARAIGEAAKAGVPMVAGLMEIDYLNDDKNFTKGSTLDSPLFYKAKEDGTILTQSDPELDEMRNLTQAGRMINLLQLAGTPTIDGVFKIDPNLTNTVTYKDDVKGKHGNWYPLPKVGKDTDELAVAYGSLTDSIRRATPGLPTWWAFWQEPDHTIGKNLEKDESKIRYLDFFGKTADAIKKINQDAVIIGIQQNSTAGLNGNQKINGAEYLHFTRDILLPFEQERSSPIPYDYISIQNYKAHRTLEIVLNSRIAYAHPRFLSMPVLINELDFKKKAEWLGKSFREMYDSPSGLMQLLEILKTIIDQPDVSYALLMRNVFSQKIKEKPERFNLSYYAVKWLNELPVHRRPIKFSGPGTGSLQGVAGSNANEARIIIWNTDEAGRSLNVDLRSLPASLEGKEISLHTMDGGRPLSVFLQSASSPVTSLRNLLIPKQGMVMVEIGKKQEQKTIKMARYARHYSLVPRTGTQAPPSGQGHYEIRKDSLVASTADNTGIGMASVVLAGVPENPEYSIDADLSVSGLPESSAEGALVMRVDYLDRNQSLSAQYFVAERHEGPSRLDGVPFGFLPATHYSEKKVWIADGVTINLPIGQSAPEGWAIADGGQRRILVSLLLHGMGPTTVVARLSDKQN